MDTATTRCTERYSSKRLDYRNYDKGWKKADSNVTDEGPEHGPAEDAFVYRSSKEMNAELYWGNLQWYDGGGYVANLGNTQPEAEQLTQELQGNPVGLDTSI